MPRILLFVLLAATLTGCQAALKGMASNLSDIYDGGVKGFFGIEDGQRGYINFGGNPDRRLYRYHYTKSRDKELCNKHFLMGSFDVEGKKYCGGIYGIGMGRTYAEYVQFRITDEIASNAYTPETIPSGRKVHPATHMPEETRPRYSDYAGTGYVAGHLASPFLVASEPHHLESADIITNLAPMHPEFESGVWQFMTDYIKSCAIQVKALDVMIGPYYGPIDGVKPYYSYSSNFKAPSGFWVMLARPRSPGWGTAFLLPNKNLRDVEMGRYMMSIHQLERKLNKTLLTNYWPNFDPAYKDKAAPFCDTSPYTEKFVKIGVKKRIRFTEKAKKLYAEEKAREQAR